MYPLTGAYYWVPRPMSGGRGWDLVTCHDLGAPDSASHREIWPSVVDRLAALWDRERNEFQQRLRDHYYGLPRGRVTNPKAGCVILHGNDAPLTDGLTLVRVRFRLSGANARTLFVDDEQTRATDVRAVEEALGLSLGLGLTDAVID
jgi:hypothetical protein